MSELSKLPNIGKKVEEQLNIAGIVNVDQLNKLGSKESWLRIKEIDEGACTNLLYALEGAIQGIRWHNLSDDIIKDLKDFYKSI